ncbi:elongin-B [Marchantia polymorpha subsp. ruderalis]|uniref:Ubiquitin-like domain-containing protein n=2 Tax=Marchantia polymorpha TaxID=3197 RepID=A0AAF6B0V4_MARPO|nr:hypothetical protein MARPO_0004s0198 [Marchantia polymorpha]BBN05638.1 hypothetical protein Mp_3g14730 [Marchantia polymorpha subsp. ruderalis]|eukprot:PTQ48943.1 hypothetical protein MARPO_0004s0198 [Marchantia polymorpha]
MAMFIRVKRKKTTYFLHCDPSETVLEIKQKLQALSDNPVDCQRLILLSSQLVLEDSRTLADQKVENDAIVALCLKTSDPRVHRISTGLRPPPDPKLYEIPEPRTPKKPLEGEAEEVKLGEDGQPLPPPPPEPVLLERAMSTVLRTPYKPPPPTPEEIAKKEASDKEAAKLEAAKKGVKDDPKKQGLQKDAKGRTDAKSEKEDSKKGGGKKDGGKKGEYNKNEKKEAASKGAGKKGAADKKKGKKKKGAKDEKNDKPEVEEILPPPDTGVWEDICIDRLTDYATLIDSD